MAILLAGTSVAELSSFVSASASNTAGRISTLVVEGVNLPPGVSETVGGTLVFDVQSEIYTCFYIGPEFLVTASNTMLRMRQGNTPVFRLTVGGTVQLWNGSSYVSLTGSAGSIPTSRGRVDVYLKLNDTEGVVRIYRNRSLVYEFVGDTILGSTSTVNTIDLFTVVASAYSCTYSAWIVANEDTRPLEYTQLLPATTGSTNEWDGNRTEAAGSVGFNDATFVTTTVANETITFDLANVITAARTGYTVDCLVASARVRTDSGNVGAIRLATKSGE